jgi:hypothetical protein
MQGVYIYIYINIPETNHVPKEYNVAAILSLLFMVPILLVYYYDYAKPSTISLKVFRPTDFLRVHLAYGFFFWYVFQFLMI